MNREAAALGVPVYSVFRGKIGAVDQYLAHQGRLILLESAEDVPAKIVPGRRNRRWTPANGESPALRTIVKHITAIMGAKLSLASVNDATGLSQLASARQMRAGGFSRPEVTK
jgi:predicted glycosyltransferase